MFNILHIKPLLIHYLLGCTMDYKSYSMKIITTLVILFSTVFSQYPNIRIDDPSDDWQPQEVSITINPTNPQNIVVGSNKNYYYYSFDGGSTWEGGIQTSQYNMCGDPCVVFDAEGTLYYGHISEPATYWPDRIVVHRSIDGGITWTHEYGIGYIAGKNQDKEWVAVDLTDSDYRGNVYVSWTQFDEYNSSNPADKTIIRFSRSTNKGETWSTPIKISDIEGDCLDDDNALEGAVPVVGPNGEIYIAWAGHEKIYFDKSLDGGVTFGTDIIVTTQPDGWTFDIPGIYRCNGMPVTCCDISNSPYRGTIYINWSDQRNGTSNTDIFISKSTDGGETWSAPKMINDDSSDRHQFFTWMCVDPITGYLYVVFYDRRNTTGNATEVYAARSTDGGETFENFKVSESSFTPISSIFFGDYTNIAALNGKVYPTWMRLDGNTLSIWMTKFEDPVDISKYKKEYTIKYFEMISSYTNPFTSLTTLSFKLLRPAKVSLSIYNMKGKMVKKLLNNKYQSAGSHNFSWNADVVGSGIYFYKITAGDFSSVVKCIVRE